MYPHVAALCPQLHSIRAPYKLQATAVLFPQTEGGCAVLKEGGGCAVPTECGCAVPTEGGCAVPTEGVCAVPAEGGCPVPRVAVL